MPFQNQSNLPQIPKENILITSNFSDDPAKHKSPITSKIKRVFIFQYDFP